MLFREVVIYIQDCKEFINTFCKSDENSLSVEVGGAYSYHCALKAVLCINMDNMALHYFRICCLYTLYGFAVLMWP
jgi:hypothetical protein